MFFDFLLLLFSIDFLLYGFYVLILLFVILFFYKKSLVFNMDFVLLSIFSILYIIINYIHSGSVTLTTVAFPISYAVGLNLFQNVDQKQIKKIVLLLSYSAAAHAILNLIYNSITADGINYNPVQLDFWSRAASSATAQMLLYTLAISLSGYFLFGTKHKLPVFLAAIPLFHTVLLGGRTIIVLFLVSVLVGLLSFLTFRSRNKGKTLVSFLLITVSTVTVLSVLYTNNIFGIRESFESSHLYARLFSDYAVSNDMTFFTTSRFDTKLKYLQNALSYPFGGSNMHTLFGSYAHDAFLDTYDAVGILPTLIWIVCVVKSFLRYARYIHLPTTSFSTKILLRCVYCCILISFFIEPIVQGSPIVVAGFFMIDGVVTRALSEATSAMTLQQSPVGCF